MSKETRKVYGYYYKEIPVDELRAKADALEREPYGASKVIPESEARSVCGRRSTVRSPGVETIFSCQNKATHYVYGGELLCCKECAREIGKKEADELRHAYRL